MGAQGGPAMREGTKVRLSMAPDRCGARRGWPQMLWCALHAIMQRGRETAHCWRQAPQPPPLPCRPGLACHVNLGRSGEAHDRLEVDVGVGIVHRQLACGQHVQQRAVRGMRPHTDRV